MASRDFELERCPFCGGAALLKKTSCWDYFVRCEECGARSRQYHENDVGAVNAWNRRSPKLPEGATLVDASGEVVG